MKKITTILAIAIAIIFTFSCGQKTEDERINTTEKEIDAIKKEKEFLNKEYETILSFRPSNERIIEMNKEFNDTYTIDTNSKEGKIAYKKYNTLVKKQHEEWEKNGRSNKYQEISKEMEEIKKPYLDAKATKREELTKESEKIQKLDKHLKNIAEKQEQLTEKKDSIIKAFLNASANAKKQTLEQKKYVIEKEIELEMDEEWKKYSNLTKEFNSLFKEGFRNPEIKKRREELTKKMREGINHKRIDSLKTVLDAINEERLKKAIENKKEEEKWIKEEIERLEKINPNFAKSNEEDKHKYGKIKFEMAIKNLKNKKQN